MRPLSYAIELGNKKALLTCDRSMANASYYARWATDSACLLNHNHGQMDIVEDPSSGSANTGMPKF